MAGIFGGARLSLAWGPADAAAGHGESVILAAADLLFESFYSTKEGGMGIGLSICRSIIEAHQGQIWATANVPRGATLHITLPASQKEALH